MTLGKNDIVLNGIRQNKIQQNDIEHNDIRRITFSGAIQKMEHSLKE
jgi:hypothetical protein